MNRRIGTTMKNTALINLNTLIHYLQSHLHRHLFSLNFECHIKIESYINIWFYDTIV